MADQCSYKDGNGNLTLIVESSTTAQEIVNLKGNTTTGALLVDLGSTTITATFQPSTAVMFTGTATDTSAAISTTGVADSAGFVFVNTGSKAASLSFDNSKWVEILPKGGLAIDCENLTFYVKTNSAGDTSTYSLIIRKQS